MSSILASVKQSDQERKQGDVPNLQTVHLAVVPEQKNPWFIYALLLVLLLALAFAIGVLIAPKKEAELASVNMQEPMQVPSVKREESLEMTLNREQTTDVIKAEVVAEKAQKDAFSTNQHVAPIIARPTNVQSTKVSHISDVPY